MSMLPYKSAARLAPLAIACLSLLTPLVVAQETPPATAPVPETQPDQPKPTPEPTKPDPQPDPQPSPPPVKPDPVNPAPANPGPINPAPVKPDAPKVAPQPAVATPAPAPETGADVPEGRQLFLAAADIIKKAHAITFRCKTYGVGPMLATYTAKTQADVRLLRTPTGWLYRGHRLGRQLLTQRRYRV